MLVKCHTGCTQEAVIDALRGRGLWPDRTQYGDQAKERPPLVPSPRQDEDEDEIARIKAARAIWFAGIAIKDTAAELYLWSRGIGGWRQYPTSLRYVPTLYNSEIKRDLPALVGAIQRTDGMVTGIQRIWLSRKWVAVGGKMVERNTKAPVLAAKKTLGIMANGAVRLGRPAVTLGIAEGIETALAARRIFSLPVWATLGASRMGAIEVPENVRRVIIFADNGKAGEAAARKAADAYELRGLECDIEFPPAEFGDFNDWLLVRLGGEHELARFTG